MTKILKVTSGSTPEAAEFVDQLYKSIITAGTHKASSIKVAEAAKVIENSQRDIQRCGLEPGRHHLEQGVELVLRKQGQLRAV